MLVCGDSFAWAPAEGETPVESVSRNGAARGRLLTAFPADVPARALLILVESRPPPSDPPIEEDGAWADFSRQHGLVFCRASVDPVLGSPSASPPPAGRAAAPDPFLVGAREIFLGALDDPRLKKLPVYLFGFDAGSAVVSVLVSSLPDRVKAWATYGGESHPFTGVIAKLPPGLIGSGTTDSFSTEKIIPAFEKLRMAQAPVAWLSLSQGTHARNAKFEEFARLYFTSILAPAGKTPPVIVHNATMQRISSSAPNAAATSELPSPALVEPWRALHTLAKTIQMDVATNLADFPKIRLILRPPPAGKRPGPPRLLCYAPFFTGHDEAISMANDDDFFWNQFAAEHGMAVLVWVCGSLAPHLTNTEDMDTVAAQKQDRAFDAISRAWNYGVTQLCRKYGLPENDMLLYGCSRGSNFAQRIALRSPERFLAVNVHVANSFDRPSPKAAHTLWLVTNGALDVGVENACRFFWECRSLNFPIFIRLFPALGTPRARKASTSRPAFYLTSSSNRPPTPSSPLPSRAPFRPRPTSSTCTTTLPSPPPRRIRSRPPSDFPCPRRTSPSCGDG